MKKILTAVLGLFLVLFYLQGQEIKRSSEYQLIWADEFNYTGAPDPKNWTHEIMKYPPNDELEYYVDKRKNSIVADGVLKIRAIKEVLDGRNYTSARLTSRNKVDWKYGRVEVRAKLPGGKGTWPAIWMLYTNDTYGGWPSSGEIDIMEHVGQDPMYVHGTIHTKAYNHVLQTQIGKAYYLTDSEKAFHVYSCEWNEDSVKLFVDNVHYFTFKNDKTGKFETWPYNHDFYLILNVAIGGGWGGTVDNTIFKTDSSVQMLIDYVRLYKKASDFNISGPKQVVEKSLAKFSVPNYNGSYKFQWILPQGVEAVTKIDSNAIQVNWGCISDTIRLKIMSSTDTSVNEIVVSIKDSQIKGKLYIPENSTNIKYSIDSIPGAAFKWSADAGITFPKGDATAVIYANFSNEGKIFVNTTTTCSVKTDSIYVSFGTGQFPYPDAQKPAVIPGKIVSAYFDQGGSGIGYVDVDAENKGKAIRNDEQVDIEKFDNTYTVGWFESGEWLKYTVDVSETAAYSCNFRVASGATASGKFDILIDDQLIGTGIVKNTGDWNTFASLVVKNLIIAKGTHVLKIKSYGGFNLGTMTFTTQTDVEKIDNESLQIFPNPATESIQINSNGSNDRLQIIGMDGKIYLDSNVNNSQVLNVKTWPRGVYTARITNKNELYTQKIILK